MRVGECLYLQVQNIDLNDKVIHVVGSKTAAATRDVPIHSALLPVLQETIGSRASGLLFVNPNPPTNAANRGQPQPWNDRTVLKQFTQIAKELGYATGTAVQGLTVHSLRRFFKSTALNVGVPSQMADVWVGHSLKGMDHHYYRPEGQHEQMEKLPFKLSAGAEKEETV